MIARQAVVASIATDALAFYVLAEWMAAGYAENQHAPGAWAFLIVALAAFGVPRIASWYGCPARKVTS